MASPEGRRSPSPSPAPGRDMGEGFLFKGTGNLSGTEEMERLVKQGTSPRRPVSAARAGFDHCQDYSKINQQRMNAGKVDTFHTPGGLNDKTFNTFVKVSKRDLYEICEQSFRNCVNKMTKDILRDLSTEMTESLEQVRQDANVAAEAKEGRDATNDVLMKQIHENVYEARKADVVTFQKEIRSSELSLLEGSRDMLLRLEGKIMQDISQVRNEVQDMRRAQERSEESILSQVRDVLNKTQDASEGELISRHMVEQLTSVLEMQKSLNATTVGNCKEILKVQEEQSKQGICISRAMEEAANSSAATEQIKEVRQEDIPQLTDTITDLGKTTTKESNRILNEIVKIQKALNVDFASVREMRDEVRELNHARASTVETETTKGFGRTATETPRGKRMRDYFTQTEGQEKIDQSVQTDEKGGKKKPKGNKGKSMIIGHTETARYLAHSMSAASVAEQKTRKEEAKRVFADAEAMKIKVRQALIKKQYNVNDHYHKRGLCQKIVKDDRFQNLTFLVIFLNAIWISIDIDQNDEEMLFDAHPVFQVAENFFCGYFTLELTLRFFAFRDKKRCLRDFWFVFDSLLVLLMVAETWVLSTVMLFMSRGGSTGLSQASILRLIRLAKMIRISRMVRLLRAFPEIVILLKGIMAAARSVSVFLMLWLLIIYVFAIVFRSLTEGDEIGYQYFINVPTAMNTLLLDGILPDFSPLVNDLGAASPILWPIIIFFILLSAITLMYMLIGVLCDVVAAIAAAEKEGMTVIALASQLRAAWEDLGRDPDASITKMDFKELTVEPEIVRVASNAGVDVVMLTSMADVIFEDYEKEEKDMCFEDFVELMLKMRGGNAATVKDVREHLKVTRDIVQASMDEVIGRVDDESQKVRGDIAKLTDLQQQIRLEQLVQEEDESDGETSRPPGQPEIASKVSFDDDE